MKLDRRLPGVTRLTPRELEVLHLAAIGVTERKAVAAVLGISHRTVGKYREDIMRKLGAHTFVGAVAEAARAGVIG